MPPNWPTYAWYTAAAILGLVGAFLLIKWLIGDRSKGRRRCPKCWYDMSGTASLTCTECGNAASSSDQLLNTRRGRAMILSSLLAILLAVASTAMARGITNGWRGALPSTLLLVVAPFDSRFDVNAMRMPGITGAIPLRRPPARSLQQELMNRYWQGDLWDWQYRSVASRMGRWPLVEIEWRPIHVPERVIAGEPVCICADTDAVDAFFSRSSLGRNPQSILLVPRLQSKTQVVLQASTGWGQPATSNFTIGALAPGTHDLIFDVFYREAAAGGTRFFTLKQETWRFPIVAVEEYPGLHPCPDNPSLTDAIRKGVFIRFARAPLPDRTPFAAIAWQNSPTLDQFPPALHIELRRDDTVIATASVPDRLTTFISFSWSGASAASEIFNDDTTWRVADDPRWSVRLYGDGLVFPCGCRRCWSGSWTAPLSEFVPPSARPK